MQLSTPRGLSTLLGVATTLQVFSLLVPLRETQGLAWDYNYLWPVWMLANAVSRPDRVLLMVDQADDSLIFLTLVLLSTRAATMLASICCYGYSRKRKFASLVRRGRFHRALCLLVRADCACRFILSHLLCIPILSFLTSVLVPTSSFSMQACLLPATAAVVLVDRGMSADVLWTACSGVIRPEYAVVFSGADIAAAILSGAICANSTSGALLLGVLSCGVLKCSLVYKSMPYHNYLQNAIESCQGLLLAWVVIVLSLAAVTDSPMTADYLYLIITPLLLIINLCAVHTVMKRHKSGPVDTYSKYAKAIQTAMASHQTLDASIQANLERIQTFRTYPLVWTLYYLSDCGETHFAKVAVSVLWEKKSGWLRTLNIEVCLMRVFAAMDNDVAEVILHDFLSLAKMQAKVRELDMYSTQLLAGFFESLETGDCRFSDLVSKSLRLSSSIHETTSAYQHSISRYPQKNSLRQSYTRYLSSLNRIYEDATHSTCKTYTSTGLSNLDRYFSDDPGVVVFVVPLGGVHAGKIEWASNAGALGYLNGEVTGLEYEIVLPRLFRDSHQRMVDSLARKTRAPAALRMPMKTFVVNKFDELISCDLQLYGAVQRSTGVFVIVMSIRVVPPLKDFGIIGPEGRLLECTPAFAAFARETDFIQTCDLTSSSIQWKGVWNSKRVSVSKDEWRISTAVSVPCVSLHTAPYNVPDSAALWRQRADRRHTALPNNPGIHLRSSSTAYRRPVRRRSSKAIIKQADLVMSLQRLKKLRVALVWGVMMAFVCSSVILLAVGFVFQDSVVRLDSASYITSIGMRMLSIKAAIRSKELYLLNTGYLLYGNETKARNELTAISTQMRSMRGYLYGNLSSARGEYRRILLHPQSEIWRFEQDEFRHYLVPVLDLMDEIAHRTHELAKCPLENVTVKNSDFMTLYRNGAAESLQAFNLSVGAYASSRDEITTSKLQTLSVACTVSSMLCMFISAVACIQLLLLVEKGRKRIWTTIIGKYPAWSAQQYRSPAAAKVALCVTVTYCVLSFLAVVGVHSLGHSTMSDLLLYKPSYVNLLGMRRAMTVKSWFHMRESWLPSDLSYASIINSTQPVYDHLRHWEQANNWLWHLQHCFTDGCMSAHLIFPTKRHKEWLMGRGCDTCETPLTAGLTPLINELLQLSAAARSDLRAGLNSDYKKGKAIERYTALLLPALTASNELFDSDTKQWMAEACEELMRVCGILVCVSLAVLAGVMYSLLMVVVK